MPSEAYWRRRYERAEAGRLAALNQIKTATMQRIDTAADDLQQQVDALEQLLLKRAALVNVEQDGRKIRFTFTRRGALHQVMCYADMSVDTAAIRRELLEG